MTVETVAGSTISICANAPATFDKAGYDALPWVLIGEVTDLGNFGRVYALVTHQPIATRGTKKIKGSFNEGTINLVYGVDEDDSGQIIVLTAVDDDGPYSIRIVTQSGKLRYFQVLVMSAPESRGTVDNVVSCSPALEITTSDSGVGIVRG